MNFYDACGTPIKKAAHEDDVVSKKVTKLLERCVKRGMSLPEAVFHLHLAISTAVLPLRHKLRSNKKAKIK